MIHTILVKKENLKHHSIWRRLSKRQIKVLSAVEYPLMNVSQLNNYYKFYNKLYGLIGPINDLYEMVNEHEKKNSTAKEIII